MRFLAKASMETLSGIVLIKADNHNDNLLFVPKI